ncbi:MAG: hypothetical protein U0350_14640 [Caldilineaceae bacterium]
MQKIYVIALPFVVAFGLLAALLTLTRWTTTVQAATPLGAASGEVNQNPNRDNAVIFWDNVALDAIRQAKPGPPVVARILAVLHTAMYDAWSQYDATAVGTLLGDRFRQPAAERTLAHKSEAISYAAYRVLKDLFPAQEYGIYFANMLEAYGYDPNVTTTDVQKPAGIGNLAAAIVILYRHHDGANQLGDLHSGAYTDYTGYQPVNSPTQVNDPNHWQPLLTTNGSFQGGCLSGGTPTPQTYVGPHWGRVIPFALDDGPVITPTVGPILYPSPEFTIQAQEILSISGHLTDREKAITEYWADGPTSELPPGHWALFSQFVSARDHHTVDDDAKLFFAVSNANLDAGILAWKIKRIYDSVRPITAIHELFRGQQVAAWAGPYSGTKMIAAETWQPFQLPCFVTPAFPEYLSGHSTFSAASAEVLKSFTGSDIFSDAVVINAGSSRIEPGQTPAHAITLTWATFSEAADQAGISRRYGGIHFERGDLEGRKLGRQVGARVWQKAQTFFIGAAAPVADMTTAISTTLALDDVEKALFPNQFFLPLVRQK